MINLQYFKQIGNYKVYEKSDILIVIYKRPDSVLYDFKLFYQGVFKFGTAFSSGVNDVIKDQIIRIIQEIYKEISLDMLEDLGIPIELTLDRVDIDEETGETVEIPTKSIYDEKF